MDDFYLFIHSDNYYIGLCLFLGLSKGSMCTSSTTGGGLTIVPIIVSQLLNLSLSWAYCISPDGFPLRVHLLNSGRWIQLVSLCLLCQTMLNLPPKKPGILLAQSNRLCILHYGFYGLSQCHCIKGSLSVHEFPHARNLQPHYLGEMPFVGYLYPPVPRAITF